MLRLFRSSSVLQRRCYSSTFDHNDGFFDVVARSRNLEEQRENARKFLRSKKPPPDINNTAVFANTQLNLSDIDVYGFDYDYTLAQYTPEVEAYIHDTAKQVLVEDLKYPKVLLGLTYDPEVSLRGIHYDVKKGLLLKMDANLNIQPGSVYRGRQKVDDDEVIKIYKRLKIPQNYVEAHLKSGIVHMVQLVDIFAKPMISLLSGVSQWFLDNHVKYVPESLFLDVVDGINRAHPLFHELVTQKPEQFLKFEDSLAPYLSNLKNAGKKIFLITNSKYEMVNAGMNYMVGHDWTNIFDVIIVQANKPRFFTQKATHFRQYLPDKRILSWKHIHELKQSRIYARGSLNDLVELTDWDNDRVLYFGDHPYNDLADLSLNHGWRTGAIIQELEDEIRVMNTEEYKNEINWATVLQLLIEINQTKTDEAADRETLKAWQDELDATRQNIKNMYNPFFGSMFRTHQNSSYFSRRLFRFADIYTSQVTNLGQYTLHHTFYPRRGALPHDFRSWFV